MLVLQAGNDKEFTMEDPQELAALLVSIMQNLDCDDPSGPWIRRPKHPSEATRADFVLDGIGPDFDDGIRCRHPADSCR